MQESKSFLFITALTPKRLLTPLRHLLFEAFLQGLKNQTYHNWEAILIGEEEKNDGNIHYLKIGAEAKEIKLIFAREYIRNLSKKPDYIIRIDDDDVISPQILQSASMQAFDCFADRFHLFYDIVSGKISFQKRHFLANTVIHKYEHAVEAFGSDNTPLMQCDHSTWIEYYKDKKLLYTSKDRPVYLRVLSPTTVTNGIHEENGQVNSKYRRFKEKIVKLQSHSDIDLPAYKRYLLTHGKFRNITVPVFVKSLVQLDQIWAAFSGKKREKKIFNFFKF